MQGDPSEHKGECEWGVSRGDRESQGRAVSKLGTTGFTAQFHRDSLRRHDVCARNILVG